METITKEELLNALKDAKVALEDWHDWYQDVLSVRMKNYVDDRSAPESTSIEKIKQITTIILKATE